MDIQKYLLLWQRFPRLTLLVWTLPLLVFNGFHYSLLPHDEGFYAIQARWIWESGDWLTPQFWGFPIYDRTIGIQWCIALAYHLLGLNEWSVRLPSALFCIAAVLLTYEVGKILADRQIAWLGAALLMLMGLWTSEAHIAQQNTALVAIELLGILALLQLTDPQFTSRSPRSNPEAFKLRWGILAGATVGWGFLMKGFMIFVPMVALLPYILLRRCVRPLSSNLGIYLGLIIGAIPTILWLALSCQYYGSWMPVRELFTKLLFLSKTDVYNPSPIYYFWNLPVNIFPWALFSIIGAIVLWRKLLPQLNYAAIGLTLGYPLALFILLSLFRTRMPYYMLQLMPFMAILAATAFVWFARVDRHPRWYLGVTWLGYAFSGLGILLAIAAILVMSVNSLWGLTITPEIRNFGLPALALGLGWLTIPCCWGRWQPGKMPYWLASWLLPAWLTFAILIWQGAFSDKTPEFKLAFSQLRDRAEIARQPVYLLTDAVAITGTPEFDGSTQPPPNALPPLSGDEHKSLVLLSFYTPQLGKKVDRLVDLPDRAYAWALAKGTRDNRQVRTIGQIEQWQLIQKLESQG